MACDHGLYNCLPIFNKCMSMLVINMLFSVKSLLFFLFISFNIRVLLQHFFKNPQQIFRSMNQVQRYVLGM